MGSDEYLFEESIAAQQAFETWHSSQVDYSTAIARASQHSIEWIDKTRFDQVNDSGEFYMIFEGESAGKGKLTMVLQWEGQESIETVGVPIEFRKVRDMYEHWSVGGQETAEMSVEAIKSSAPAKTSTSGTYAADAEEEDDVIVFVHGWRMTPEERRSFADTS